MKKLPCITRGNGGLENSCFAFSSAIQLYSESVQSVTFYATRRYTTLCIHSLAIHQLHVNNSSVDIGARNKPRHKWLMRAPVVSAYSRPSMHEWLSTAVAMAIALSSAKPGFSANQLSLSADWLTDNRARKPVRKKLRKLSISLFVIFESYLLFFALHLAHGASQSVQLDKRIWSIQTESESGH